MRAVSPNAVRLVLAASSAAIIVAGGCSANEVTDRISPINRCVTDTECSQCGGVCDLELLACVAADQTTTETIVVTVSDSQMGISGEHRFELDETGVSEPFSLTVAEPVSFTGQVVDHRHERGVVPARLTFRRQSQFDNLDPEPIYAVSDDSVLEDDQGELYNYQLRVVPGRYEIEVEPLLEADVLASAAQDYYPQRRSCAIPSDECEASFEYVDTSGVIESVVIGPEGEPIGGVRVYAYDVNDGRRISNIAVTSCEDGGLPRDCGRFRITVPETTDEFRLHLNGSKNRPLLPVLELGPYSFGLDKNSDHRIEIDDDEINNLTFSHHEQPVLYNAMIEGLGRDGARRPLVGATVQLRSVIDDLWTSTDGVFVLDAETNESGELVAVEEGLRDQDTELGIWMVPGFYNATIIPHDESEHATLEKQILVEPPPEGDVPTTEVIVVGSRAVITGVIRSPCGQLIPDAQVEAVSADGRPFAVESDEVGAFSVFVDRTSYTIMAIPPEGSLLSRSLVSDVSALDDLELDITLGWGTPISGDVTRAATQEPVDSAIVEGYYVREGDPDGAPYLISIGRFTTVDDGRFVFLLPQWETF